MCKTFWAELKQGNQSESIRRKCWETHSPNAIPSLVHWTRPARLSISHLKVTLSPSFTRTSCGLTRNNCCGLLSSPESKSFRLYVQIIPSKVRGPIYNFARRFTETTSEFECPESYFAISSSTRNFSNFEPLPKIAFHPAKELTNMYTIQPVPSAVPRPPANRITPVNS